MPAFEVLVLKLPTKKESEDGKLEEIVYGPETIIAKDDELASLQVMRSKAIPDDIDLGRLDINIRPFAEAPR